MAKIINIIFFIILIGLNCSRSFAGDGVDIYKYTELVSGSTVRLDTKKMQMVIDGHSVLEVRGCKDKLGYKCLVNPGGSFVFPAENISENMAWDYEGQKFKVVRKLTRHVLGKKYAAFLIERQEGSDNYWYLFSPEAGLLAFGRLEHEVTSTFILQGKCGFAAAHCED